MHYNTQSAGTGFAGTYGGSTTAKLSTIAAKAFLIQH
jgi:hypothetical protein